MTLKWTLAALVSLAPVAALAGAADGTWQTEKEDDGGYIEVTMAPCASDAAKTCGTISKAFGPSGEDPAYKNLGSVMIKDMASDGATEFSGGTIWDPSEDKTYKSKMEVKGDTLSVDGCVLIICQEQIWTRVK